MGRHFFQLNNKETGAMSLDVILVSLFLALNSFLPIGSRKSKTCYELAEETLWIAFKTLNRNTAEIFSPSGEGEPGGTPTEP